MSLDSSYCAPPTTVKCDNPRCNAWYEVSNMLGGHTFTCNKCGSKVTIRDLRTQPSPVPVRAHRASSRTDGGKPSSTPLLDDMVAAKDRGLMRKKQLILVGLALIVLIIVIIWVWQRPAAPKSSISIPSLHQAAI
jgi:hypothetical protein